MKKTIALLICAFTLFILVGCDNQVKSTHNHDFIIVKEKEPTCIEDGNHKYYHCIDCDKYFKNVFEETTLEEQTIPMLGHAPDKEFTTCLETITCLTCEEVIFEARKAHDFDALTGCCSTCKIELYNSYVTNHNNTYYAYDSVSLKQAIDRILKEFNYQFTVDLPLDAGYEYFHAIRSAIVENNDILIDSIELTITGINEIPGQGEVGQNDQAVFGIIGYDPGAVPLDNINDETAMLNLHSITLPTVTSIGNGAFSYCLNLYKVIAPNLKFIGENAFIETNLHSLDLPSLTYIGDGAFNSCRSLSSINAPNLEYIGFSSCAYTSISKIDFPNLKTICSYAFVGTFNLMEVNTPNVEKIEQGAFLMGTTHPDSFKLVLTSKNDIELEESLFGVPSQSFSTIVDLVLSSSKTSEVTYNASGKPVWNGYTFNTITFI